MGLDLRYSTRRGTKFLVYFVVQEVDGTLPAGGIAGWTFAAEGVAAENDVDPVVTYDVSIVDATACVVSVSLSDSTTLEATASPVYANLLGAPPGSPMEELESWVHTFNGARTR